MHWILDAFLPAQVSVWIAVLLLAALSGGLHLDGLADTADGLFSARSRERMLAIMKDSHIGTMGVLALVFAIGLKVAALSSLTLNARLAVLVLMPLAGRTAMVLMLTTLPYARPDGGLASIFLLKRSGGPWSPAWSCFWPPPGSWPGIWAFRPPLHPWLRPASWPCTAGGSWGALPAIPWGPVRRPPRRPWPLRRRSGPLPDDPFFPPVPRLQVLTFFLRSVVKRIFIIG